VQKKLKTNIGVPMKAQVKEAHVLYAEKKWVMRAANTGTCQKNIIFSLITHPFEKYII